MVVEKEGLSMKRKTGVPANSRGPQDTYEHRYMELDRWNHELWWHDMPRLLAMIAFCAGAAYVLGGMLPLR